MKHFMKSAAFTALFAGAMPSLATAQDLRFDIVHTQACLQEATEWAERQNCIGAASIQCIEATAAGSSTIGMSECTYKEYQWWDGELNAAYGRLRALEKSEDADAGGLPGYISQAEALLNMQRAWIKFRDQKCTYERAQWSGGTGGGPAEISCLLDETARQAMYLDIMTQTY